MGNAAIDGLTSATLKHLREHWWNDEFTAFLKETLRPRPGKRILDVGCGTGTGEVRIGRHVSQIQLFGVDRLLEHVLAASEATAGINQRAHFATADACHLPFKDGVFDSTYCVAVLQHIRGVGEAVREFARVTRAGGRVVAVEPDNAARYWYSSVPSGRDAHGAAIRFFRALAASTGDGSELSIGPRLPTLFMEHGIEPLSVRLFPVAQTRMGAPAAELWEARRSRVRRQVERARDESVRAAGEDLLQHIARYEQDAAAAGSAFVEIQHTMLFATVGQRQE